MGFLLSQAKERMQISNQITNNFMGLCGLLLCSLTPSFSEANPRRPSVYLSKQTLRPVEIRQLQRLLSQRGYNICVRRSCIRDKTIKVKMLNKQRILVSDRQEQRLFRIPSGYKRSSLKLRAIATFVGLFQEMRKSKQQEPSALPAFQPPPLPPKKQTRPTRTRRKTTRHRRTRKKKRRRPTNTKPTLRKKNSQTTFVAQTVKRTLPPPPIPTNPNWFQIHLGLLGGLQDNAVFPLGGGLGIIGGYGWAGIQLTTRYQTLLNPAAAETHSGLFSLSAFWKPMRKKLSFGIGVGGTLEIINISYKDQETLQIRGGLHITSIVSYHLFARFALFVQPTVFFFPQTYAITYRGEPVLSLSAWRGDLTLGVSWSFL